MLSAVPYLCQAVSGFGVGQMADLIRSKQLLSTTGTRRLWNTIGDYSIDDLPFFKSEYNVISRKNKLKY